ncbi:MAG: hypothetical protein ROR55_15980 [Devosia sp.]
MSQSRDPLARRRTDVTAPPSITMLAALFLAASALSACVTSDDTRVSVGGGVETTVSTHTNF